MNRIVIFGNSGSGKSTLAKKLQKKFNVPHLDLDTLAWTTDTMPTRKPFKDSVKDIDGFFSINNNWIIEGCYADLLEYAIQYSDEIVFLNPTIEECVQHCLTRAWEPHKYSSKEKQDENLNMLIEWVKEYDKREDEFSLIAHSQLYNSFVGRKHKIKEGESYIF